MERDQAQKQLELLKRIAVALEKSKAVTHADVHNAKYNNDIPGFEGTLDALGVLCDIRTITDEYALHNNLGTSNKELHDLKLHTDEGESCDDDGVHNDYLNDIVTDFTQLEYSNFHRELSLSFAQDDAASMTNFIFGLEYEECLGAIKQALHITGETDIAERIGSDIGIRVNECCSDSEFCKCVTSDNPDPAGYGKDDSCNDCNNENQHGKVDKCVCQEDGGDGYYTTDEKGNKDPYTYEHEFDKNGDNSVAEYHCGVRNDSDYQIRKTAYSYEAALDCETHRTTKKDCILDYVTNEFGILGARYTDIIKFAYYLSGNGNYNGPKYDNANRGYYSCAFNVRLNGHLIQGGKDQLVKGINKEGDEKYFALSFVDQATDYYKRIA